jgi:hypothetical protein
VDASQTEAELIRREGLERGPDGRIVVRQWFGADGLALIGTIVVPVVYGIVVILLLALLLLALPEPESSAAALRVAR